MKQLILEKSNEEVKPAILAWLWSAHASTASAHSEGKKVGILIVKKL